MRPRRDGWRTWRLLVCDGSDGSSSHIVDRSDPGRGRPTGANGGEGGGRGRSVSQGCGPDHDHPPRTSGTGGPYRPGAAADDSRGMRSPARRFSPLALAFLLVIGLAPSAIAADTTTRLWSEICAAEKSVLTLTNRRRDRRRPRGASVGQPAGRARGRPGRVHGQDRRLQPHPGQWHRRLRHDRQRGHQVVRGRRDHRLEHRGRPRLLRGVRGPGLDGLAQPQGDRHVEGLQLRGFGLAIASSGKRYWAGVYIKGPDRTGAWAKIVGTAKRNLSSTAVRVWVKWSGQRHAAPGPDLRVPLLPGPAPAQRQRLEQLPQSPPSTP